MASASTIELTRLRRPPPLALRFFTEEHPPQSPDDNNDPFPMSTSNEDESIALHPPWKRQLFQLMEQPTSSNSAFVIHMFSTFLIVFSALVTVLETVPAVHSISTRVWFGVETSVVALFTVEYIARCVAWSTTWMSLFRWMICERLESLYFSPSTNCSTSAFHGVIDLLSVLPYYLELMFLQDTVSRSFEPIAGNPFYDYFSQFTLDSPFFACFVSCGCFGHSATTTQFYCEPRVAIHLSFHPSYANRQPPIYIARLRSCSSQYAVRNTPCSPLGSLSL